MTLPLRLLALPVAIAAATTAGHGSLDRSFGKGGVVTTAIGRWSEAAALVVQPDGKLVVAGKTSGARVSSGCAFALVRYNSDGSLDAGFGRGGKVTTTGPYGCSSVNSLVVQPDGKLVAAGLSGQGKRSVGVLVRYDADGSLDRSFGIGGKVVTHEAGQGLVLEADGKLVTAGSHGPDSAPVFVLVRFTARGRPDRTFGKEGKVTTPVHPLGCCAGPLIAQPDGKLILAGYAGDEYGSTLLLRYSPNGSLDPSFGKGGKMTTRVQDAIPAVEPDGKIVVAGTDLPTVGYSRVNTFALARYNRNGTRDQGFGRKGEVVTPLGPPDNNGARAYSVVAQSDGRIVAAGYSDNGSQSVFTLVRYQSNGARDRSFGKTGIVTTAIRSCCDDVEALVIQHDGNLVAAGSSSIDNDRGTIAIARYLP